MNRKTVVANMYKKAG